MYKSDQLSCYKLVLTVRGVQLYLSRRRLTFFSYRTLGPQNPPETIDFTDPGGINFHSPPPRLRLWSLYLYMSFYTSDHNRRKALRIPDIMVCISREQYNTGSHGTEGRWTAYRLAGSNFESPIQSSRCMKILVSGSRFEPVVGSSVTSPIH